MRYILKGDPLPLLTLRASNHREWGQSRVLKHAYTTALEEQHGDKPLYSGLIHIDFEFYSPLPKSTKNLSHNAGRPRMFKLIELVEDLATGIIFVSPLIIVTFSARKRYAYLPRMEFKVTEVTVPTTEEHDEE